MATYRGHAFYIVDPRIGVVFCKISSWHVVGSHVLRVCHGARDERQDQCRTKLCCRWKNSCLCKCHSSLLSFCVLRTASSFTLSLVLDTVLHPKFRLRTRRSCDRWRTSPSRPHSKWPCAPTRWDRHTMRRAARLPRGTTSGPPSACNGRPA